VRGLALQIPEIIAEADRKFTTQARRHIKKTLLGGINLGELGFCESAHF
jgi:hypothetical protein